MSGNKKNRGCLPVYCNVEMLKIYFKYTINLEIISIPPSSCDVDASSLRAKILKIKSQNFNIL